MSVLIGAAVAVLVLLALLALSLAWAANWRRSAEVTAAFFNRYSIEFGSPIYLRIVGGVFALLLALSIAGVLVSAFTAGR